MSDPIMARTEFAAALNQICTERGIEPSAVLNSLKQALLAAFRKDYPQIYAQYEIAEETENQEELSPPQTSLSVVLDDQTGEFKIITTDPKTKKDKDITPPGFGRIAAQTAKQVILQQVREAEKSSIIDEYRSRLGELITAQVLRLDGKNVILDIGRGQGVMPPEEQIRGEFYRLNSRIAVVIADIRDTFRGESVVVSRSDPRLVTQLFAREVPEVGTGVVVIEKIARDPGVRTKVAVKSTQEGVDPVGSCVGQKGVRVQAVINELNGERVDIIQYSQDPQEFISAALSPAENLQITLNETKKTATVSVPEDQLSLAIGRSGQNVKLAAKLTGYKIKVQAGDKSTIQVTGNEEYEIDLLDLDTKTRNKLVEAGIVLLEQIMGDNLERLKEVRGIGSKTITEIKNKLATYQQSDSPEESQSEEPQSDEGSSQSDTIDTSTPQDSSSMTDSSK